MPLLVNAGGMWLLFSLLSWSAFGEQLFIHAIIDVYKRQVLVISVIGYNDYVRTIRPARNASYKVALAPTEYALGEVAVSYTHLDVYKRQE